LSDNLNNVVSRSMEGKDESSSGFRIYMPTRRIINENVMLNDKRRSNKIDGSGIIIINKIPTTDSAIKISVFFVTTERGPEFGI